MRTPVVAAHEPQPAAASGPGASCAEAQADGVPCEEIRDCELCGRAHPLALTSCPPAPGNPH